MTDTDDATNTDSTTNTAEAANAAQAEHWNGDIGRHWIAHRERHVAIRRRLTPRLLDACGIAGGDRVLDVGCGCGETTIAAARSAGDPAGDVLGLDLSGPMLDVARRLAADAGLANVRFVRGDAQVYPLPQRHYDVVFSSFGVMFFEDPATAFANLFGALRPGGRLAFLSWQGESNNDLFAIPERAFRAHTPMPAPVGEDVFSNPRRMTVLLTRTGGTKVHIEPLHEPARLGSDVADVMAYICAMARYRRLVAELGDAAAAPLASLAEEYAARQRPDGVWVDLAAWLVRAERL